MKTNNTKPTPLNIDADELEGFITMQTNEVTIHEGRFRPLDEDIVKVIAESIKQNGQLQPILVTPNGDLIDGNHRLHACKKLKIDVVANVLQEMDIDKLALMEIDTNLCRKELTKTEMENHLAKRKEIYNTLYPETAKRGARGAKDGDKESFGADTAKVLNVSEKSIERMVKRGELASDEIQEARDNKEITTGDVDKIITEVGSDKEAQAEKMKALIKKKAEKKAESKQDVSEVPKEESTQKVDSELTEAIEALKHVSGEYDKLVKEHESTLLALEKSKVTVKNLKARIMKAKELNPDIKI